MGHKFHHQFQQQNLFSINSKHRYSHGGVLRQLRKGRGVRPLSTKEPLHVVFKVNHLRLRSYSLRSAQSFSLTHKIIKKYSLRFRVKIEQLSIQKDHIHILIRAPRRSQFQYFFRVVAGQIAQRFEHEGLFRKVTDTPTTQPKKGTSLWKLRPFSRVVRGFRAYKIVCDYIRLNELEVLDKIQYQKNRLRGLSSADWSLLWA